MLCPAAFLNSFLSSNIFLDTQNIHPTLTFPHQERSQSLLLLSSAILRQGLMPIKSNCCSYPFQVQLIQVICLCVVLQFLNCILDGYLYNFKIWVAVGKGAGNSCSTVLQMPLSQDPFIFWYQLFYSVFFHIGKKIPTLLTCLVLSTKGDPRISDSLYKIPKLLYLYWNTAINGIYFVHNHRYGCQINLQL